MAQYDIKLHQNTAAVGTEYMEKTVTPNAVTGTDKLLGFVGSAQTPTIIGQTVNGAISINGGIKVHIPFTAGAGPILGDELVLIHQGGAPKHVAVSTLISGADSKVAVTDADDPGYLYEVVAVSNPLTKGENAGVMTLGVLDATAAQKGVVTVGTNINVSSGTISVADANGSSTKGVVRLSATDANGLGLNLGVLSLAKTSKSVFGAVQVGDNINVTAGVITVPVANTNATFGVVKLSTLNQGLVLENGFLSVRMASTTVFGVMKLGDHLEIQNATAGLVKVKEASTAQKGVAQFDSDDFIVTAGVVTIKKDILDIVAAPTNWNSTGTSGQIAFDSNYFYRCVGTNSWRRTSMAKW